MMPQNRIEAKMRMLKKMHFIVDQLLFGFPDHSKL